MDVARADLARTARLARLQLSEAEIARLTVELNGILAHVEALLAIDVDMAAQAPLAAPAAPAARPDEPDADPLSVPVAEQAPEWRSGYFTVPRVLGP
ncbi:MAG: Asp-tRNA(Asn)/Glu-tRNA(Gln) amidotransferase subunit GatC [Gemmatimonadetes bacterium]|nr:Asp-tRNA(Asn)/Glu-tRNA(Gln) amidotransferase subunit GatC [Gemmatimonadota bacterium]